MIKINGFRVDVGNFPDGTLLVKLDKVFQDEVDTFKVIKYRWDYESDNELFTLICLRRHFEKSSKSHILYLPYVPHARMDRVKNTGDVFTLKYFCEVINSLNFDKVVVRDPHSNVTTALLENVQCEDMKYWFDDLLDRVDNGNLVLFYPDEGAMKRYSEMIQGYPYAFGVKKRNWETGQIEGLALVHGNIVKGKDILIIDDICSYGGTFLHSAKALKEAGAVNISLYVTHLEANVLKGEMYSSGLINKIYTTPSITQAVPEGIENIVVL